MSMDFFLDRKSQAILSEKLAGIPSLVEDLAITITRQARIQRSGLGNPRRAKKIDGDRLPFHISAANAADELHNALSTWVRFVCEERQIRYTDHDDDLTLSRWLRKHMISLALTQGSEEAFEDLVGKIDECRRQVDLPPEDEIYIDQTRIQEANRQVLTAGQVERIACRLGPLGVGLNKRRVETLTKSHRLYPCAVDGKVEFFKLGDVLDAHHRPDSRPGRKRKVEG